jgi:hypothetical protein
MEQVRWASKYRVFILDQNEPPNNFVDARYGDWNNAICGIISCYRRDLGFPRPRGFSVQPWLERGIFVSRIKGLHTYQQLRALSVVRERCVFHLWGQHANRLEVAIERGRGHLIIRQDYPGCSQRQRGFTRSNAFSLTSDFLGVSREMWRL